MIWILPFILTIPTEYFRNNINADIQKSRQFNWKTNVLGVVHTLDTET
jgi:hypothetical protein